MDFFENRYFEYSRFFVTLIGQWPYDGSRFKYLTRFFILLVVASCIDVQVSKLVTSGQDFDIFIETFPPFVICLICFVKYITCWVQINNVGHLLNHVKHDWTTMHVVNEIEIMKKYGELSRMLAKYYMLLNYVGLIIFILLQFVPYVLDILMPLNEPRQPRLPFLAEYFVDQDEYYYPILCHMLLVVFVLFTIAGAADALYIAFVFHGCGVYGVLGYRLEHMFDDTVKFIGSAERNDREDKFIETMRGCVQYHNRILEYMRILSAVYSSSCLLQLVLIIVILSGILIRVVDLLSKRDNLPEAAVASMHVSGVLCVVFFNILPGQILVDCSEEIFYKAYFGYWYMAPLRLQKSTVLLLANTIKPRGITAYNLVTASVQVFGMIVQTSLSYFTVLYSLRG